MTLINLIEKIQKEAKRQASDQVHLLDKLVHDAAENLINGDGNNRDRNGRGNQCEVVI